MQVRSTNPCFGENDGYLLELIPARKGRGARMRALTFPGGSIY